jgi:hypothetical protein
MRKVIAINEKRLSIAILLAIYVECDMIGIGEVGVRRVRGGLVCGGALEAFTASTSMAVETTARVRFWYQSEWEE